MTDPNKTLLALVVDRSGSMRDNNFYQEMEGAITTLIADQKAQPGKCDLYVALFDDRYEVGYDGDLQLVDAIGIEPRGSTAMLGAIGKTIDDLGARLKAMAEADRPGNVIVAIITDGYENHSNVSEWAKNYAPRLGGQYAQVSYEVVRSMVERQSSVYGWHFTYLGANQDAVTVGASLGVAANSSLTYAPTAAGSAGAVRGLTSSVTSTRGGTGFTGYGQADRDAAMGKTTSPKR